MDNNSLEARNWINSNNNTSPLATNKFGNKESALAFVEKLYGLGAEEVLIDDVMDEQWRIQKEGGPYADSLKIKLPDDLEVRKNVFSFINEEVDEEEFKQEDTGQKELTLWWD